MFRLRAAINARTNFRRNTLVSAWMFAFALTAVGFGLSFQPTAAAIPKYVNFQGKLTKVSDGTNVTNGSYAVEFKLYDALTSGSLLWTETYDQPSGACTKLVVTNGVFNAKLGSCNALTSVDFTGGSLYLTVNFAPTGTSYDGEMSPRKQLVAAPFAFVANALSGDGKIDIANTGTNQAVIGYDGSNKLQVNIGSTGFTTLTANGSGAGFNLAGGNVGIGDATPAALLTVGSGDLFQVNSSGAIAAATGVTSSGTITFSGFSSNGGPLYTNGSGVVAQATAGTSTQVLHGGTTPSFSAIALTTDVSGTLPVGNGGTGATTFTANGVLYGNTASAIQVTAAGTTGQCLIGTTSAAPSWGSCGGGARLDQITAATGTASIDSTNKAIVWDWSTLNTETGLKLSGSGTGLTSGSVLNVTSATTGAVATNGIVSLNASGNYTSTSNVGLLEVAANSTTAGTVAQFSGTALTTGQILNIASGTALTTGSAVVLSGASYNPGAGNTGKLIDIGFTNAANSTSGTATAIGLSISPTISAAGSGGIHETYGVYIQPAAGSPGAGTQNNYGLRIGNQGRSSSENSYGLYVDPPANSTLNNFAAFFNGRTQASPLQYNTGTASQSTTTITGSGTTWNSLMVGSDFVFANGTRRTITAFTDSTHLTAGQSGTVSSQAYNINYPGLHVDSSGNVEIGTIENPSSNSRLYVYGGTNGANIDVRGNAAISDQSVIELEGSDYDSLGNSVRLQYYGVNGIGTTMGYNNQDLGILAWQGVSTQTALIATQNNIDLHFGTNNTERMVLDKNGNLGINTVSPATKLDVAGTLRSTATTTPTAGLGTEINYNSSTQRGNIYVFDRTGIAYKPLNINDALLVSGNTATATVVNNDVATNDSIAKILFSANRTTSGQTDIAGVSGVITDITDGAYKGALVLSTANNAAPAERVRIDNTGQVGIGTTGPGKVLDINSAAGNNLRLTYNDSNGSATNYADLLTTSAGALTIQPSGFIANIGGGTSVTDLRFLEPSGTGTDYVGFKAPANVTTSVVWALPAADSSGCFQSNGSGIVSIASCGSAGANTALSNLASVAINTDLLLGTSDGGALGSTTKQWSDLFLAEGGVINWDNGDATLTQVGDVVTLAGADLKVTTPGNASTSVVTTDGTQTLSNKTLTAPKFADLGFLADANGNEQIILDTVASAVNEITIANAATGNGPTVAATGGDTDVALSIDAKGAGALNLNNTATGNILFGGGSGSTGCTVTNSSGAFACTAGGSFTTLAGTTSVTSPLFTNSTSLSVTTTGSNGNISLTPNGTGSVILTSGVTTGTSTTAGLSVATSTLTTGNLVDLRSTSTAAGSNTQTALNIATSGTNGTSAQTTYGAQIANTHDGTTSTNVGLLVSASGGASANYAALFTNGNVGIGNTAPNSILHVGPGVDTPFSSTHIAYFSNNGDTNILVRDSTNDVEGMFYAYSGGILYGSGTNHSVSIRTNNLDRITISNAGVTAIGSILQVGSATATTYSRLGTGATGHSLDAANDLLISDDLEVDGDAFFDGNLTVTGTCTGCGGGGASRLDQILAATADSTAQDSTNKQIAWDWSTITTQTGLKLQSTGTGLTSGSVLNVTSATTGAVATNGIVSLNASGAYTSTSNAALLNVTANATIAGTVANFSGTGVTTGIIGNIGAGSGITSGAALKISASGTSAIANGLVQITHSGAYTSTGGLLNVSAATVSGTVINISDSAAMTTTGNLLTLTANSATTATGLVTQSATGLTTGFMEASTLGSALTTGGYLNLTGANYHQASGDTGNLLNIAFTQGTTTSGAVSSTVNGLLITPTINTTTSSSGVKTINAIKVGAPTLTACSGGATCTYTGLNVDTAGTLAGTTIYSALFNGGGVGIGNTAPAGKFDVSGAVSGTPSATVGAYLAFSASTFTDNNTAGSGTATGMVFNSIAQPTLAASNSSVTTTTASTFVIQGAPIAGTNQTLTNKYSLFVKAGTASAVPAVIQGAGSQTGDLLQFQNSSGTVLSKFTSAGALTINISSATALAVQDGSANNVFVVDTTAPTTNAGIDITAGSAQSADLLDLLSNGAVVMAKFDKIANLTLQPVASTSGTPVPLTITGPSDTGLAASTEKPDVYINLNRTVQFATGALTNQRAVKIVAPAYAFVGASTITIAATLSVDAAPTTGTNATITNKAAILAEAGNVIVKNGSLCVGNVAMTTWTGTRSCANSQAGTAGTIYAVAASVTAQDYAENYYSKETLAPGTVVGLDQNTAGYVATQPAKSYDLGLLGVTSTNPGITIGNELNLQAPAGVKVYPIALVGRVPVKVTNENGPIQSGDYLTSSATMPGYAMRATYSGRVIGQALESFTSSASQNSGSISVFVKVGYQAINNTIMLDAPQSVDITNQATVQGTTLTNPLAASRTSSTFIIKQQAAPISGSGQSGTAVAGSTSDILQLQSGEANRLLVANSGAFTLSGALTSGAVLTVKNNNQLLLTVSASGNTRVYGTLIVKQDLVALGSVLGSTAVLARNVDKKPIHQGDLVMIVGAEADNFGGEVPIVQIKKAVVGQGTILGVADKNYNALVAEINPPAAGSTASSPGSSATADILPNDYLNVVTNGSFKIINIDGSNTGIAVGDKLTLSTTAGLARKWQANDEQTSIGVALDSLSGGSGSVRVFLSYGAGAPPPATPVPAPVLGGGSGGSGGDNSGGSSDIPPSEDPPPSTPGDSPPTSEPPADNPVTVTPAPPAPDLPVSDGSPE